jgi:hypothetical protein
VVWTQPEDLQYIPATPTSGLGTLRKGDFLAAFADGTVRRVSTKLEVDFLRALFSANGRESVDLARLEDQPAKGPGAKRAVSGLLAQAEAALARGDERRGLAYLMADGIVRESPEVLGTMRWCRGLDRAVVAVRWGLAFQAPSADSAHGTRSTRGMHRPGVDLGSTDLADVWGRALGQPLIEKLTKRIGEGEFGAWLKKVGDPTKGEVPVGGVPKRTGIVTLGRHDAGPARAAARKEGLDMLLMLTMVPKVVAKGRGQFQIHSTCTLEVVDVVRNKVLLSRVSSSVGTGSGPGGDNLTSAAKNLLADFTECLDGSLTLAEKFEFKAELAQERAEAIVASAARNPLLVLPGLLELRFYQSRGLLKPDEVSQFYGKIVGAEDGPRLATGPADVRREIAKRLLEK